MAIVALVGLALGGCSDLSRPSSFRVSRDATGTESQVAVAPNNLVRVPGPDGKPIEVPRLHPPGTPSAGMPVLPGQKVERPQSAASAAASSAPKN
jgi:hypothetical protein